LQSNSTQPASPAPVSDPVPRSMQFALFLTGLLWLLASDSASAHAAQGIADRLNLPLFQPLLQEAFFLFLLLTGFATISWIATRSGSIRNTNALPTRPTAAREWQTGVALGWAMLLVAVLPMVLAGDLHPQFWLAPRAWGTAALSLLTLALGTLALEAGFRGFLYRRLIAAIGPIMATILLSAIYALSSSFAPNSTSFSVFVAFLLSLLFSMAYLRTHALWLGWGLHFAWTAAMGIFLGLPVAGRGTYNTLVDTNINGAPWLTGGAYGPEGALLTAIVLLAAMAVLYRLTRDYAWQYTHAPIIAAGYPMDIAPPPAHTAMEKAAAPASLVQILAVTATAASTSPTIDDHLRSTGPKSELK
jgi:membrane protease YdiL (CAAX protease family)